MSFFLTRGLESNECVADETEDPLARYLNRDYWQARHDGASESVGPTAPTASVLSFSLASSGGNQAPSTPTLAGTPLRMD